MWRVVFSRGGEAGCFIIRTEKEGEKKSVQPFDPFRHVQLLTFLIHNSMVKVLVLLNRVEPFILNFELDYRVILCF